MRARESKFMNMTNKTIEPAKYWRMNKKWPELLGKEGRVVAATTIRVAPPNHQAAAPYDYLLIELGEGSRIELMAVSGQELKTNDKVRLVLRRTRTNERAGLVNYQLKAEKMV
ncbi:MAG: hypothetical protein GF381_04635 [Candidatus Pacebacteria bacterium]|nr:hypothetical protein [Candidatus Paceibacterota bacterium]